jgi:hypothetical protein
MDEAVQPSDAGTITIEWAAGSDPEDASTYAWRIRAEPALPDELVAGLLAEIGKMY